LDVAQLERPDLDLESLTSNLSLVQGELLPGFYEDWIVLERERILSIFDSKMGQLLDWLVASNRWTAVQEQAERWLAVGNAPEPAFRALMLAYGARGDMVKVSSVYQRCISELKEQYGLEPSAETRALYDGLLKGANVPGRQPCTVRQSHFFLRTLKAQRIFSINSAINMQMYSPSIIRSCATPSRNGTDAKSIRRAMLFL
jgi:DNA-binding SARP family transcriptional activator